MLQCVKENHCRLIMNIQRVFWFCFVASFSSVSKAAKSLSHEINETNFNLQSEMKLSSNSTTAQPLLLSSDIRSEAQDVVSYLPKQNIKRGVNFNVEKSKERDDASSHSLTRNSDVLGEVSLSLNDNNEHGAKGNSSYRVKSTINYETPLQDNSFGSSTKEHVSSGHSEDNGVSNYYYEDEGVTENELQKGITKTEANDDILRNLKSEVVRVTLSEPSAREGNLVTYTTDISAQSMLLDEETRGHDDNTDTTDVKAPNDTGNAMQSEPDHAAQHNALEYTDNTLGDTIKNGYTGRSTSGIVTHRIKEFNSLEIREGIYRSATAEESAERYRTLKHTLGRDREPSHSPNQVENDYAYDYYEVWRQNKDQSTTMSATERMEIKATNDKNQREYVPYFSKLTSGTEKIRYSTSNEVTSATLDYDSTLSEEGVRATTGIRKQPVSTKNVPYFPTEQDAEHTFGTENVKNVYIYDEVKTAAYDHEEGVRATIVTRKPPESVQNSANSEDVPKTVKMELFRDLENVNVANNNATPRQLEEKYSSIETTTNGSSSVSEPTVSPYGTSMRTSYTKTMKFNCSANESEGSTIPQGLTALKSVHNFGNGSEIDLRAQRGSWRKDFQVSDDFAASEDCHAGVIVKEDDREDTRLHELPSKQTLASDNSDIPENYDTCAENDTNTTALKEGTKLKPETQKPDGEVWNKQAAKNKLRNEDDKIDEKIMAMAGSMWKLLPKGNNRAGVRETSLSEYPWFVIIETSSKDMRCAGAMVAPRWLMTASSCVREDDTRTDAYSTPVQVRVNVTGKWYQAVRAVFAPGGGVALVRLAQPPERALFSAGRLDLADVDPPTLWTCCVALGMGSCEEEGRTHWEQVLAVGTWAAAVEDSPQQRQSGGSQSQRTAPSLVRAPCGADPGAPLACHRRYMGRAGLPPPSPPPDRPPENEPEGLYLVAVAAGYSKSGLGCRGSYADYWNVATLQGWMEDAIVRTNTELGKTSGRRSSAMLPPDPYSQRLHRMRMEGSLPEPRVSRAATRSCHCLLPLLTAAAASYTILLGSS